ncbi:hypothetical protein GGR51DRAFT_503707, partial [Nemania sp. FL0031]
MGAELVNMDPKTGVSYPPKFIPANDERQIRRFRERTLPSLTNRLFVNMTLYWFTDATNSDSTINCMPDRSSSIVCLSSDSGHEFEMFPVLG